MEEISGETLYQVAIQMYALETRRYSRMTLFSLIISFISVIYGACSFNVFILYQSRPRFFNIFKILLIDSIYLCFLSIWHSSMFIVLSVSNANSMELIIIALLLVIIFCYYLPLMCMYNAVNKTCRFSNDVNPLGTLITVPYIFFKGKFSLQDIKIIRITYSILIFIMALFLILNSLLLSNTQKEFFYDYVLYLIPLMISGIEFTLVTFFDILIFKWAYDYQEEAQNNDEVSSVEII